MENKNIKINRIYALKGLKPEENDDKVFNDKKIITTVIKLHPKKI